MSRQVLLLAHLYRKEALDRARAVAARLGQAGVTVRVLDADAGLLGVEGAVPVPEERAADGVELALVLGGDGTLLRAAEVVRRWATPLLGVNLGHYGFLAEAEATALAATADSIVAGAYTVEERMTVDVEVDCHGRPADRGWALNEVAVEKSNRNRLLECLLEIDGRPLSRWGCDGVLFATPTGSTAYAFSAGGPVVWPEVEALLVVPISAHALFSRPLVVDPTTELVLEVLPGQGAVLSCDGRRTLSVEPPTRIVVRRGRKPVRFARLHQRAFTDRLVAKFNLPVQGWRGPPG